MLTKRGRAAWAYFLASLRKPAREIQPGDRVWDDFIRRWRLVADVRPNGRDDGIEIRGRTPGGDGWSWHQPGDKPLRVFLDPEMKAALRAEALAYQATLTKAGKPRKRRAASQCGECGRASTRHAGDLPVCDAH